MLHSIIITNARGVLLLSRYFGGGAEAEFPMAQRGDDDGAGAASRHPDGGLLRPMMNAVHKGNR